MPRSSSSRAKHASYALSSNPGPYSEWTAKAASTAIVAIRSTSSGILTLLGLLMIFVIFMSDSILRCPRRALEEFEQRSYQDAREKTWPRPAFLRCHLGVFASWLFNSSFFP